MCFAASVFACSEEREFDGSSDGGQNPTNQESSTSPHSNQHSNQNSSANQSSNAEFSSRADDTGSRDTQSRDAASSETSDGTTDSSAVSVSLDGATFDTSPREAGAHPSDDGGRNADAGLDASSPDAAGGCTADEQCSAAGPCWTARCSPRGECLSVPKDEGALCGAGQEVCSDVDRCDGAGNCLSNHLGAETPVADPTPGDCLGLRCDGNGATQPYPLDADVPSDTDKSDCTIPSCTDGVPSTAYAGPTTACEDGLFCTSSDTCDGRGTCVGGTDPCAAGANDSNCSNACDEDANTCTAYDPIESACGDGLRCNAVGQCVQCLGDNECPGYGGGARNGICDEGWCIECRTDSHCGVTCEIPHCVSGFCDNDPACGGSF